MTDYEDAVNAHYGRTDLAAAILEALEQAGKDVNALTLEDLAPIEEFHIGGREATLKLGRLAGLSEGVRVVDVGCGIGGPARALAHHFGCHVTGVDLTEEFCSAGTMLTERTGLSGKVVIRHGSALDLPFDSGSFDVAWTQHVTMNIDDKDVLFAEIRRVLRPRGSFAMYEIFAGPRPVEHYPVPWASDPGISFLTGTEEVRRLLESAGFTTEEWHDVTQESIDWFRQSLRKAREEGPPSLSLNNLLAGFPQMAGNVLRNLEEDRLRVARAVLLLRD